MATSKKTLEAYAQGKELTDRIVRLGGRCMEQVIDRKFALFFERWMFPNGVGVVVMYSPTYKEVFIQAAPFSGLWKHTDLALQEAAENDGIE